MVRRPPCAIEEGCQTISLNRRKWTYRNEATNSTKGIGITDLLIHRILPSRTNARSEEMEVLPRSKLCESHRIRSHLFPSLGSYQSLVRLERTTERGHRRNREDWSLRFSVLLLGRSMGRTLLGRGIGEIESWRERDNGKRSAREEGKERRIRERRTHSTMPTVGAPTGKFPVSQDSLE